MQFLENGTAPILGCAWGLWLYSKQPQYTQVQFPPGIKGHIAKRIQWLQTGYQGACVAGIVSAVGFHIINEVYSRNENDIWVIARPVRALAMTLFFLYSRPTNQHGFRALPQILNAVYRVFNEVQYETIKSNVLCINEIYRQPFRKNFSLAPFDFVAPTLVGATWGAWLFYKQDSRPRTLFPAPPPYEEWFIRKNDQLQSGYLGFAGSVVSASLGLFTFDQHIQPFFNTNTTGKVVRFGCWLIYGSVSYPHNTKGFKAIPTLLQTNLNMFKFVNWTALLSLYSVKLKDIYSLDYVTYFKLSCTASIISGVAWGAFSFYVDSNQSNSNTKWISLLGSVALSSFSVFNLFHLHQQHLTATNRIINKSYRSDYAMLAKFLAVSLYGDRKPFIKLIHALFEASLHLLQMQNTSSWKSSYKDIHSFYQNTPERRINLWANNREKPFEIDGDMIQFETPRV